MNRIYWHNCMCQYIGTLAKGCDELTLRWSGVPLTESRWVVTWNHLALCLWCLSCTSATPLSICPAHSKEHGMSKWMKPWDQCPNMKDSFLVTFQFNWHVLCLLKVDEMNWCREEYFANAQCQSIQINRWFLDTVFGFIFPEKHEWADVFTTAWSHSMHDKLFQCLLH